MIVALCLGLSFVALPAFAQDTMRIRGTVERIEGPVFVVKTRDGSEMKLTVTDNPLFLAIVPAKMSDIKPGMFVGSAGMMQEDGSQKAIEVHIFPETMRGTGEGHYDWDLLPKSKMTNGNVEQAVTGVDGPVLSVKYKDSEKKRVVTPQTVVVTYEMGKRDEIQPGTRIFIAAAKKHISDAADYLWQKRRGSGVLKRSLNAIIPDSPCVRCCPEQNCAMDDAMSAIWEEAT
jgi:hypothetical protein